MKLIYRTKCKAIGVDGIKRKGKVAESFEFYGKRKYSCWGYVYYEDDEPGEAIEECRKCPLYVWNVNEEFNKYIKEEIENGI